MARLEPFSRRELVPIVLMDAIETKTSDTVRIEDIATTLIVILLRIFKSFHNIVTPHVILFHPPRDRSMGDERSLLLLGHPGKPHT